jgi:glycerol-3-phosphate dehydrogenase
VKTGRTRNTALVPRDHTVLVSRAGLVTVTGGKWTTYRKMAEDTVERASAVAGLERRRSTTADLGLHGCVKVGSRETEDRNQPWAIYGSDASALQLLVRENPSLDELLHPALPYHAVQVVWAARHEMARTVEDALARRTRALFLDARASIEAAPKVAKLMAKELGRDQQWQGEQLAVYRELAAAYLPVGGRGS